MRWDSIFFAFLARSPDPLECQRFYSDDTALDDAAATMAYLDRSRLPGDAVTAHLGGIDYLLLHQLLWERVQAGIFTPWSGDGRVLLDKIQQMPYHTPVLENSHVAAAVTKDMRRLVDKKQMRPILDGFDCISVFQLHLANENAASDWAAGDLKVALGVVLHEKIVPWILANPASHLSTLYVDIFRYPSLQKSVYDALSLLDNDHISPVIQSLNCYALYMMKTFVATQLSPNEFLKDALASEVVTKAHSLFAWYQADPSSVLKDMNAVFALLHTIRMIPEGIFTVALYDLLELQRYMMLWRSSSAMLGWSLAHGSVTNCYLDTAILDPDLNFVQTTLLYKSLVGGHLDEGLLHVDAARSILSALKQWPTEWVANLLVHMEYHHLLRLRPKSWPQDAIYGKLWNRMRYTESEKFERWLTLPTSEWESFEMHAVVLCDPIGAAQVVEEIIRRPDWKSPEVFSAKLQRMGYFSLLLLKDALSRPSQIQIPNGLVEGIDSLLPAKKITFAWLMDNLVDRYWFARHIVYALGLLPDHFRNSWIDLDVILALDDTIVHQHPEIRSHSIASNDPTVQYYGILRQCFIENFKTLATSYFDTIRNIFQDTKKINQIVTLLAFQSPDTIRSAINEYDYNHLLVLHYRASWLDGVQVRSFQATLRGFLSDNSASYFQPLKVKYALPYGLSRRPDLSCLEYLSLLQVRRASCFPLPSLYIHSLLPTAKVRWRSWFSEHHGEVTTDRHKLRTLLTQLLLVLPNEYLLTPPGISRVGDQIRVWYPNLETDEPDSLLPQYWAFIKHAKYYDYFRSSDQLRDEKFRTHIWQHEQSVHSDKLEISVRFDKEVLFARRSDVHDAIDWIKVRNHWDAHYGGLRGLLPPKPPGTDHDSLALQFLLDDKKENGLLPDWFKSE